jgi:hypothetical protein
MRVSGDLGLVEDDSVDNLVVKRLILLIPERPQIVHQVKKTDGSKDPTDC